MKNILGRKQSIKNGDWLKAMENIGDLISKAELEKKVSATVQEIQRVTTGKKAAYAWSAGKDSIVLGNICEMAGVCECMIGVCNLEYPEFMTWIMEHRPDHLEVINTGQDMEWLVKHPGMLFPQNSKVAARWFAIVQHRAQAQYYKEHDLDMILLGRRRADGNMRKFWDTSIILIFLFLQYMDGRTDIFAVPIHGRLDNGQNRYKMAGKRFTILSRIL